MANFGADVFVSIHCNAFHDSSAQGVEPTATGSMFVEFSKAIQDSIIASGVYTKDRE